jgi:ubiquinone/menaquinone biosynthesis C-methylase UbiE
MTKKRAERDFDELSAVYDETRQPLDPETLGGLRHYLQEHRWKSILEVGVGTGRIAQPLAENGWHVVGLDVSRGMLARAAAKGLPYLVHGTAYHLPFPDRTFDAALFVHVLHVLDEPGAGLREAARATRSGVLAIMDRSPEGSGSAWPEEPSPREVVRRVLVEEGYPDLLRPGPRAKEREILRAFPPTEVRLLSDREVTEPLAKQLDAIERRGYRHVLDVPPELLARAVGAARARIGSRTVTYRRRESIVWWSSVPAP